ncbi:MAG: zinc-dependent metalloprotease, partial [Bacteroidia bacterium]
GGLYGDNSFDKGRTMTHEVGHFLGLRHIWGEDGTPCVVDDYCNDTPRAGAPNYGCPAGTNSCPSQPGNDMIENYMDYTDDACMNIFTVDQKARITTVMNNATRRLSLKTSTKDQAIPLFTNDAELKLENVCATASGACGTAPSPTIKVTIYNRGTATLTSAVISYNINGGTNYTYPWTGNLAQNKFATFDMPVTNATNGTFNGTITTANGVTDQRASNNSVSAAYTIPSGPPNYTFNNYVFRLQRDLYGSETTWNLKNQAGTILYSGGPYTDTTGLPALITQNWTLANNNCYTFTINDAYSDGICCNYGTGYYDIKSTDGTVIVASGASFGATESKVFTVNVLSNETFETLNDIYVYPNPANNVLNIAVPTGIELVKNVTIYNYLGQTVGQKNILTVDDLSIDTTNYSSGVYLITVSNGTQSKTLRFIKE